jgi:hypothetical protein
VQCHYLTATTYATHHAGTWVSHDPTTCGDHGGSMNGLWATHHTTWIQPRWIQPRLSARRARLRGRPSFPARARYQLHAAHPAAQPGQHERPNSGANPAHGSGRRPASAQCRPAVQAPWPGQRQVPPRRCHHTPSQAHAADRVHILPAGRTVPGPCRAGRGAGRPARPHTQRCRPCVSPRHQHRIGPPGRAARRRPDRAGRDDLPYRRRGGPLALGETGVRVTLRVPPATGHDASHARRVGG